MNAGAKVARGGVLLFLHADTKLPDEADRIVCQSLEQSARAWGRFDVAIDGAHPLLALIGAAMNIRSRLTGIATGDQAIFVTRQAFMQVGLYPEIPLMEDIALSRKLKRVSRPACVRARVRTSGRRWEENGVFRTLFLMWRLRLAFFMGRAPTELARRYGFHGNPEAVAIAIMAKAPVPGLAKTRLAAKLGASGAAEFQANCIKRMTQVAVHAAIGPVTLWATPDTTHPVFVALAARLPIALKRQSDGDLGSRMLRAMQDVGGPTLVIGVDCPGLEPTHLRQAAACLQAGRDAVLIPAEDGGYVLIGGRAPQPRLFDNMEWSNSSVSAETRRRLTQNNLTWDEPALLFDIDEPRDLHRLTPEQASALLGEFRAATASK